MGPGRLQTRPDSGINPAAGLGMKNEAQRCEGFLHTPKVQMLHSDGNKHSGADSGGYGAVAGLTPAVSP